MAKVTFKNAHVHSHKAERITRKIKNLSGEFLFEEPSYRYYSAKLILCDGTFQRTVELTAEDIQVEFDETESKML